MLCLSFSQGSIFKFSCHFGRNVSWFCKNYRSVNSKPILYCSLAWIGFQLIADKADTASKISTNKLHFTEDRMWIRIVLKFSCKFCVLFRSMLLDYCVPTYGAVVATGWFHIFCHRNIKIFFKGKILCSNCQASYRDFSWR
jgi:hypothetical protein